MTEVLVFGQPYWGSQIARLVNRHSSRLKATFCPPTAYARVLWKPPRETDAAILRVGYRVGASTVRGRLFDEYWSLLRGALPNVVTMHYWLGTDVRSTISDARAGTVRQTVLSASQNDLHFADAPWLAAELRQVGLTAVVATIPTPGKTPAAVAPFRGGFRVLTYLPEGRFKFYGGDTVLNAACLLRDVPFDIVGSPAAPRNHPLWHAPNVHWHGWVREMSTLYDRATVVVRIPSHDGFGGTVVEGLRHGRYVVYTHDVPFVRKIEPVTSELLVAVLAEFRAAFMSGQLLPNFEGREYALREFDEARLAQRLVGLIEERV